jgi:hypothetical protein
MMVFLVGNGCFLAAFDPTAAKCAHVGRLSGPISPKIGAVRRPLKVCQNVKERVGTDSFYKSIEPNFAPRAQLRSLPLAGERGAQEKVCRNSTERSVLVDGENPRVDPSP